MAKLSRQTKEIIQIVVFLLVVGILLTFYVIYPLNRTKVAMGRFDVDNYNNDSLVINDVTAWAEAGLGCDSGQVCDTFRIETDGQTTIAGLRIAPPDSVISTTIKGTVCLLHRDGENRDSLIDLARFFLDSGYIAIVYDQRATSRSTSKYHGEGQLEANDLDEVIRYLDIREIIVQPVVVIGFELGADAALLAQIEEPRIAATIAIEPYLTSTKWLDKLIDRYDIMWFPFQRTILWWWYGIRSSYASPYRELENIQGVRVPTLVIAPEKFLSSQEVTTLKEASDNSLLTTQTLRSGDELQALLYQFVASQPKPSSLKK